MDSKYTPLSTLEGAAAWRDRSVYPAERRQILPPTDDTDIVFIKTAGDALQAVPQSSVDQGNLIPVHVPWNHQGGDEIYVRTPVGSVVSAIIPEGCFPGHAFFVRVPDDATTAAEVVMGTPVERSLESSLPVHPVPAVPINTFGQQNVQVSTTVNSQEQEYEEHDDNTNLELIQVPQGSKPGDRIHVQIPDGRTIEALVPQGNVPEFYVRLPSNRQQATVPLASAKLLV